MKRNTYITTCLLALLLGLIFLPTPAKAETEGDFQYAVTDGKATLTKYTGTESTLTLPTHLGGCTVTAIGSEAFAANHHLKEVIIPTTYHTIGPSTFEGCGNLTEVTTPSGTRPPVTTTPDSTTPEGIPPEGTTPGEDAPSDTEPKDENGKIDILVGGESDDDQEKRPPFVVFIVVGLMLGIGAIVAAILIKKKKTTK